MKLYCVILCACLIHFRIVCNQNFCRSLFHLFSKTFRRRWHLRENTKRTCVCHKRFFLSYQITENRIKKSQRWHIEGKVHKLTLIAISLLSRLCYCETLPYTSKFISNWIVGYFHNENHILLGKLNRFIRLTKNMIFEPIFLTSLI